MGLSTRSGVLAAVRVLWVALFALHPPLPGLRCARSLFLATALIPMLPYSAAVAALLCSNRYAAVAALQ